MHRYIPYTSPYDTGSSKQKVIEIIYDDTNFQTTLKHNRHIFIMQLSIVLIIILIITTLVHKWVAKQVYLAYHDGLTKLKNRTAFDEIMQTILSKKNENTTAFMMIDLDNFKLVNDYLGHDRGDHLLQLIGHTLKISINEKGTAFRLGGDEFAVVLPNTSEKETIRVAKKISKVIETSTQHECDLKEFHITASIGICLAPDHGMDRATLYKNADIALYHAKEKGKSQFYLYDDDLLANRRDYIIPFQTKERKHV